MRNEDNVDLSQAFFLSWLNFNTYPTRQRRSSKSLSTVRISLVVFVDGLNLTIVILQRKSN